MIPNERTKGSKTNQHQPTYLTTNPSYQPTNPPNVEVFINMSKNGQRPKKPKRKPPPTLSHLPNQPINQLVDRSTTKQTNQSTNQPHQTQNTVIYWYSIQFVPFELSTICWPLYLLSLFFLFPFVLFFSYDDFLTFSFEYSERIFVLCFPEFHLFPYFSKHVIPTIPNERTKRYKTNQLPNQPTSQLLKFSLTNYNFFSLLLVTSFRPPFRPRCSVGVQNPWWLKHSNYCPMCTHFSLSFIPRFLVYPLVTLCTSYDTLYPCSYFPPEFTDKLHFILSS